MCNIVIYCITEFLKRFCIAYSKLQLTRNRVCALVIYEKNYEKRN